MNPDHRHDTPVASTQEPRHRVSVALASYNGATFLRQQLESLEQQTLKPDELVVCDDQSTDHTVEILRDFAARASFPVRVHVNDERLGWRGNFLKASGLCKHDLIAFCDQDDIWYPEKLGTIVGPFHDPEVMLVHHNADLVDARGDAYGTLSTVANDKTVIAARSRPTHWSNPLGLTMIFRGALIAYNDLWIGSTDLAKPDQPAAHDQWFYFLATNLGTVVSTPERLLAYRQHAGNSVGWTNTAPRALRIERADLIVADLDRILGMLRSFCRALGEASRRGGPLKPGFDKALEKNEALVHRLERRRSLYRARALDQRIRIAIDMTRRGDYSMRDGWGLGVKAHITDLTKAVFGLGRTGAA